MKNGKKGEKLKSALNIGIAHLILLMCSVIVGFSLLLLAYCIPQKAIYENTRESVETLYGEWLRRDGYYEQWEGIKGTIIDYFTDGLIVNTTFTEKGNLIENALLANRVSCQEEISPLTSFYSVLIEGNEDYSIVGYERYWHGYQIIMRPLLALMSVSSIRFLNMIMQLALILLLFIMLYQKEKGHLIVPYFVMWISLIPTVLFNCFQYSSCFLAMIVTSMLLVLLWRKEKDTQFFMKSCLVFELGGIILAYFDILTYPLVALGVPLVLFLSMDANCREPIKVRIKEIIGFSVSWIVGYLGMWFGKWGIATLFTGVNVVEDAQKTILFRTSHSYGDVQFTWIGTIGRNASFINKGVFSIILLGTMLLFAGYCVVYRISINLPILLAIFIVSLYPFVWYFFTMNHSSLHAAYTWRELVISIYGMASLLFVNLSGMRRRQKNGG